MEGGRIWAETRCETVITEADPETYTSHGNYEVRGVSRTDGNFALQIYFFTSHCLLMKLHVYKNKG